MSKEKKNNSTTTPAKETRENIDDEKFRKEIMDRISTEMGEKDIHNVDLVNELDVADNVVSAWFSRNTVKLSLLRYLHEKHGIDLNYIICGHSGNVSDDKVKRKKEAEKALETLSRYVHKL